YFLLFSCFQKVKRSASRIIPSLSFRSPIRQKKGSKRELRAYVGTIAKIAKAPSHKLNLAMLSELRKP
ncbi:hypothetical protein KAR91_49075, partial [Candidatus Pacearchaeota archaeon]|nr:hypothetical protein [Candidatus Pacearchaeota archaeon]